ncbi:hypothetical protein BD770DRAFT_386054 [Pilaira anomala]|nr:hypothetical protein BD770DRAFT_386054 [Pilaira anomala]
MNTQELFGGAISTIVKNSFVVARYHFQQLADDNEAAETSLTHIDNVNVKDIAPHLPQDITEILVLQGTQKISKFNEKDAYNTVEIILAVVRLTNVSTDFVISVNAPVKLAAVSSEQESIQKVSAIDIETVKQENWELFG